MNAILTLNTLETCVKRQIGRVFYASSACVYPEWKQAAEFEHPALREDDALHGNPDGMYGWEKLYGELACQAFAKDHGLQVRIGRFHGVYGPHGSWCDGREKAPAAMCRKAAQQEPIEVWGDGTQRRSFMYVDDAVEGMIRLMNSDYDQPVNLGSDEMVTIDQLAEMAKELAGNPYPIFHVHGPTGPHGRSSDNTLIKDVLGWAPSISLREGMAKTYAWIEEQVRGQA